MMKPMLSLALMSDSSSNGRNVNATQNKVLNSFTPFEKEYEEEHDEDDRHVYR